MGLSSFFRRFRLFSRLDTAKADADDATTQPKTAVIIHHGNVPIDNQHIARATTKAEMQASASDQTQSYFFRLPLEIRRLVYRELWSDYFKARDVSPFSPGSDLRLHIYSDGFVTRSSRRNLCHLRCMVDHDASSRDDSEAVNPWPFDTGFRALPPLWFWFACIVRLHWGHHMQCQNAVMGHWDPFTGKTSEPDKSPFLPLFLACKKIYWEAIESFFENVTLIFTSSEDAKHFFLQQPHPSISHLRSLELSFTNGNDHLFLTNCLLDLLPDTGHNDGNTELDPRKLVVDHLYFANLIQDAGHEDNVQFDRSRLSSPSIGMTIWNEIRQAIQTSAPNLRHLNITFGGRLPRNLVLAGFGYHETEDDGGVTGANSNAGHEDQSTAAWSLPGTLLIHFKRDGRRYVQQGGKIIRQNADSQS